MNVIDAQARRTLTARRKALEKLYQDNSAEEDRLQSEVEPDWPDRAAARESSEVLNRLTNAERNELQEIDAALARIHDGSYGSCLSCGGPIGRQRLRAIPEARHCIQCSDALARAT